VEAGVDRVLHELREKGVTADELTRAKKAFIAEFVYESDSQSALARRYAEGMLLDMTIEQVNDWPAAIAKVTAEDISRVAAKHLDIRHSVTGKLIPAPSEAENAAALTPAAGKL
jgi:zinc protease